MSTITLSLITNQIVYDKLGCITNLILTVSADKQTGTLQLLWYHEHTKSHEHITLTINGTGYMSWNIIKATHWLLSR